MDASKLYKILTATTIQLRKGEVVTRSKAGDVLEVVEINAMPHVSAATDAGVEVVDLELLAVGVDKIEAEKHKDELIALLNTYPDPQRLAGGPSYIEVGAVIGDQGAAFQLFALGKVLGLWQIITPSTLHLEGEAAREAAGRGFIMITGYAPAV